MMPHKGPPRGTLRTLSTVRLPRRLVLMGVVPVLLVAGGTLGYHVIEGWSLFDALYMTVITLTTVGYGETHELHFGGRLFTMALLLGGVFTLFYVATETIRTIISGEIGELLGRQQMERALAEIADHVIVCGYGRMGRLVCGEFSRARVPFVIIDAREEALRDFRLPYGLALVGDATSDEILRHAGVERARGLVTVMASDANNLFTTLSARLLNARLYIVARVEDAHSEQKLSRAGANRVVSPYQIGGTRVAQAMLRPTVVDFIELATRTEHIALQMEETRVAAHSPLSGCKLKESRLRADLKIIIVAIKQKGGAMVFNPDPDTVLQTGDTLVAIGHKDHLQLLEDLANPRDVLNR